MFSGFLKNNEFNAQNNINKKWKIRHDLSNFENTSFVVTVQPCNGQKGEI